MMALGPEFHRGYATPFFTLWLGVALLLVLYKRDILTWIGQPLATWAGHR